MFELDQIITATKFVRNFSSIGKFLGQHSEALLITQKSGEHLVLMNARIYEGLLHSNFRATLSEENKEKR